MLASKCIKISTFFASVMTINVKRVRVRVRVRTSDESYFDMLSI